ncbi:hypothetical protein [Mycolicibacterium arenosum]|uniref:Uncharacterized protein n=1 Tax=Mycolicibacterium arenosum TaxID=2952157 RepID=A0ABT1LZY0_9MYCO|nr:hypothetical protein [Mycolicibacterium sp. CAU 1645]MCP9272165.1 hypothetical protein [Mycolicibacterium sp. CAU 1645]
MASTGARLPRLAGVILAGVGVAHLTNPHLFTSLTRRAFPRRTRRYVYLNGVAATAIGLGIRAPRTRMLATIAGVGYGAHLGGRASSTARRRVLRRR